MITGGDRGIQTLGLCNANAALYQLSYIPVNLIWWLAEPLQLVITQADYSTRLGA